jgi:DNA-binding transcriptional MerR regulator
MNKEQDIAPLFSRGDVAKILQVTPATIANRERKTLYPEPARDLNNKRIYSIEDILLLQVITYKKIDAKPIISIMHDKDYTDPKKVQILIDAAIKKITK